MTDLKKRMEDNKKMLQFEPREEKIRETIEKSKEAFLLSEQDRMLSYDEFIRGQFRLIRKRWWIFQFFLLILLWMFLMSVHEDIYVQRSMGITASLFVILIIPEIWKNKTCQSMEIELSSYYSLRQIYAARMLLFGVADILLLTAFMGMTVAVLGFDPADVLIQFLLPMTITACICFRTLCCKRLSEIAAVALCILWSSLWLFIVLNDHIYTMITIPIWIFLLVLSIIYLGVVIYQTLKRSTDDWEEFFYGTQIK